jgi:phosphoglycerate dehydrogenase-like enzyme
MMVRFNYTRRIKADS